MSINNPSKEEQLSITHINNLKAASNLGNHDILYINEHRPLTVELSILNDERKVKVKFTDEIWNSETILLNDYSYLMNTLILS